MPVIGHAFAGCATAVAVPASELRVPGRSWRARLWVPALIALAYLPDVASQAAALAGSVRPTEVTHSLVVGAAVAPALAWVLSRAFALSFRTALAIAAWSVLGHDVLDLLQVPERLPFWPLSKASWLTGRSLVPASAVAEALVFGIAFLAFALSRRLASRKPRAHRVLLPPVGVLLSVTIVAAAAGTHVLRERRDAAFEEALRTLELGEAAEALVLADAIGRWPSTVRPGRADYVRGEAYCLIGDLPAAERHYLRAYEADSGYFWAAANLALARASGEGSASERRRRAAPWVARLERDFAGHRARPAVEAQIRALLSPERETTGVSCRLQHRHRLGVGRGSPDPVSRK